MHMAIIIKDNYYRGTVCNNNVKVYDLIYDLYSYGKGLIKVAYIIKDNLN